MIYTEEQVNAIIDYNKKHCSISDAMAALDASIDDKETAVRESADELQQQYIEDLTALYWLRDFLTNLPDEQDK